jgi:hypothetical protein
VGAAAELPSTMAHNMDPLERYNLLDSISRELQKRMKTREINVYLGGYGIEHNNVNIVDSKRVYVERLLSEVHNDLLIQIASDLGLDIPTGTTTSSIELHAVLTKHGLNKCQVDFDRAFSAIPTDPSSAIGSASSTLESICKAILDAFNQPYPTKESLGPLVNSVFELMDLSPESHADPDIKRVLGGLLNAGVGLGVMRTKYSSFHGKGSGQRNLATRHARLAVNCLSAVGLFLIETYLERFAGDSRAPKKDEV